MTRTTTTTTATVDAATRQQHGLRCHDWTHEESGRGGGESVDIDDEDDKTKRKQQYDFSVDMSSPPTKKLKTSAAVAGAAAIVSPPGAAAATSNLEDSIQPTTTTTVGANSDAAILQQSQITCMSRKMRECQTLDQVMALINQQLAITTTELPESFLSQALNICFKLGNAPAALELSQYLPHSERCQSQTLSICGKCGYLDDVMRIIVQQPFTTQGPYNAAIAAFAHAKDSQRALHILRTIMPQHLVTGLTVNAALACLAKLKDGKQALELIREAPTRWKIWPDRAGYHITLSALLAMGEYDSACDLVQEMIQAPKNSNKNKSKNNTRNNNAPPPPNAETFSRLAAAVAHKEPIRAKVFMRLGGDQAPHMLQQMLGGCAVFADKWNLPKIGRGKTSYWKLGQLQIHNNKETVVVGLVPNRNPSVNGMRVNFYHYPHSETTNNNTTDAWPKKIGYFIMINSAAKNDGDRHKSQFIGEFVHPNARGQGLAKIWLAVWLKLCFHAGLEPTTGLIHKPLLSLVLQHSLGMTPCGKGGVPAELSPGSAVPGQVVLYSPTHQALEGVFSHLDCRHQNILLSKTPPEPRGRIIVVNTCFEYNDNQQQHDHNDKLHPRIAAILEPCDFHLVPGVDRSQLLTILLGTGSNDRKMKQTLENKE